MKKLWQMKFTLTNDNDPQLQALAKNIQEHIVGPTGWFRLGRFLMKVAQFEKAQQVFDIILEQTADESEKREIYYQLAWNFFQRSLPPNHPRIKDVKESIDFL